MVKKVELVETEFRKEKFETVYQFYLCEESGERFEDENMAQLNLETIYSQYRVRHSIPFPEQLVELRNKYDLTPTRISEILRFGVNTYRSYEAGEIPSLANALILDFAFDPRKFAEMVERSEILKVKEKERLLKRTQELVEHRHKIDFDLKVYFMGNPNPDEESGFKKPDLKKFAEMVIFFATNVQPYKTKLNKLLFYSDFYNFKKTGYSISGVRYCAIDMGPVPNNFQSIFEYLEQKQCIKITRRLFENVVGEQFQASEEKDFDEKIFSSEELNSLNSVAHKLGKMPTDKIIKASHEEDVWQKNFHAGRKLMNYLDAFSLKAI